MPTTAAPTPGALGPLVGSTPLRPPRDPATQVELVAWPSNARRREQLRSLGLARVLVLEEGADPPLVWDDLEDWVRASAAADEVTARCERVRAAAATDLADEPAPVLVDTEGTVRRGDQTVHVGAAAAPVLAALVQHVDRPVGRDRLADLVADGLLAGGLDALLGPLRRSVRPLGIGIEPAGPDALVLFVDEVPEGAR